jgi:hypothetical protein
MVGVVAWWKQGVKQHKVYQHVCHGDCILTLRGVTAKLRLTDQLVSTVTYGTSQHDIATVR